MRAKPRLPLLILAVALMVGVVAVVTSSFLRPKSDAGVFNVKYNAYEFRFLKMTQGTNHVIYSGNSWFARLKRALYNSPLSPLVSLALRGIRAECYSWSSPTNETVLWVGWSLKDYRFTVTNGIPYPAKMSFAIDCFLSEPGGRTTQLRDCTGANTPFIGEMVEAWELPANLTNWAGCTVHLKERPGPDNWGDDVATIELQ